jgi:sodium transport system permease protein
MRWSIIRLIWFRELRDQLRDRRTLFMITVLPLLLYPILGVAVLQFAAGFAEQPSTIALVSGSNAARDFPPPVSPSRRLSPLPVASWLALVPGGPGAGPERTAGTLALVRASHWRLDFPLLVQDGQFAPAYRRSAGTAENWPLPGSKLRLVFLDAARGQADLEAGTVQLLLSAAPDFWPRLEQGERPALLVQLREGDERSRQALLRLNGILLRWKTHLKEVRLIRQGLPSDFDDPFELRDAGQNKTPSAVAAESISNLLMRVFPFMLVMWSLAGALYPAVDLCAGEKERGTMETLLISPASREEIVLGKFLTIWVFSAATALLNLASMGLTTWQFGAQLPQGTLTPLALFWCVLLSLPLSAFFSAIGLAVGAYARSSKEGQYYLLPLFLLTMPLIFLTLAPGVELNSFYSMVPVTGVALLMQRLMTATALTQVPWFYFLAVLAPIALYSWLALRWAIEQFQREEVLFREAERLDLGLYLRRLFRDKEPLPTTGQALFCFGLLLALRWLSLGLGSQLPLLVRTFIVQTALVAAPPLFMALLLTTRPRRSLYLKPAPPSYLLIAVLLLPLAELAQYVMSLFPDLVELLQGRQTLFEQSFAVRPGAPPASWWAALLILGLLPAVAKEIAFRGFILRGLQRRFAPWTAIVLSSFLFALYHMNVFVLVPFFLLGLVLGVLAVRSGSLLPGMLLHLGCNTLLIAGPLLEPLLAALLGVSGELGWFPRLVWTGLCTLLAVAWLWRLNWRAAGGSSLAALLSMPARENGG